MFVVLGVRTKINLLLVGTIQNVEDRWHTLCTNEQQRDSANQLPNNHPFVSCKDRIEYYCYHTTNIRHEMRTVKHELSGCNLTHQIRWLNQ